MVLEKSNPLVSVIIPCRNEEKYITSVLETICNQDYHGKLEIIVVDAMSQDHTREKINGFEQQHECDIAIIDNEKIIIPAGLNAGIRNAKGEIILRMDGHAIPEKNYIRTAVNTLLTTGYDVVGGICKSYPAKDTNIAKAIAFAISHPFGVGDSRFRLSAGNTRPQFVDTVPFGCFKKILWEKLGGFDESLLTNEDYDFNYRVRQSGGKVYLEPQLITRYYARDSLNGLMKQYYRYGRWKCKMLKKQPRSIKWRHAVPPVFLISIILFAGFSFFSHFFRILLLFEIFVYLFFNLFVSIKARINNKCDQSFAILPIVFIVMHFSWGFGMLKSFFEKKS